MLHLRGFGRVCDVMLDINICSRRLVFNRTVGVSPYETTPTILTEVSGMLACLCLSPLTDPVHLPEVTTSRSPAL
jgi:hypothetical protein